MPRGQVGAAAAHATTTTTFATTFTITAPAAATTTTTTTGCTCAPTVCTTATSHRRTSARSACRSTRSSSCSPGRHPKSSNATGSPHTRRTVRGVSRSCSAGARLICRLRAPTSSRSGRTTSSRSVDRATLTHNLIDESTHLLQVIERTQLEEHARKVALSAQPRESFQESASRVWADEVLPSWDVERTAKRTLMLWWEGLPSSMRADLWRRAIGDTLNAAPLWERLCADRLPADRHVARLQASPYPTRLRPPPSPPPPSSSDGRALSDLLAGDRRRSPEVAGDRRRSPEIANLAGAGARRDRARRQSAVGDESVHRRRVAAARESDRGALRRALRVPTAIGASRRPFSHPSAIGAPPNDAPNHAPRTPGTARAVAVAGAAEPAAAAGHLNAHRDALALRRPS